MQRGCMKYYIDDSYQRVISCNCQLELSTSTLGLGKDSIIAQSSSVLSLILDLLNRWM